MDPWGTPAAATVGSAGTSPPPAVPAPASSGPWGPAPTDPWGVGSPTSPTTSDPWAGGAAPTIAPPPDPWGETSNRVNNVDPWGNSGKQPVGWSDIAGQNVLAQRSTQTADERGCEHVYSSSLHHSISHVHNSPITFSVSSLCPHMVPSHMLTCFQFVMRKASMQNPFTHCLKGFLSSCFCSGLAVAVSQPKLSSLTCLCLTYSCFLLSLLYLN